MGIARESKVFEGFEGIRTVAYHPHAQFLLVNFLSQTKIGIELQQHTKLAVRANLSDVAVYIWVNITRERRRVSVRIDSRKYVCKVNLRDEP